MKNIPLFNSKRCFAALLVCVLLVIFSFLGIVRNLLHPITETTPLGGIDNFKYYTVLSAMIVNICAVLCIPFQIQGIRKYNYHLPRWIVDLMYVGVSCTTMTFLIVALVIAPVQGFCTSFLAPNVIYLHLTCPVLAFVLFGAINFDHSIKKNRILFSLLPTTVYAIVYYIEVFVITEKNGGWIDHYFIKENISVWLLIIITAAASCLVSVLLLAVHNFAHRKYKEAFRAYYTSGEKYNFDCVQDAVRYLGEQDRMHYTKGRIEIPVHIIQIFQEKYTSDLSDQELYKIYIEAFCSESKDIGIPKKAAFPSSG